MSVHELWSYGKRALVMKSATSLVIGMDCGVTSIKAGVVFQGHVIDHAPPIATQEFDGPPSLIEAMAGMVAKLVASHPGIVALGVGMPGFVDFHKGWVHELPNVPGWESVPLGRLLGERVGLPTVIDSGSNCMAIAEWRCGTARGLRDVVFINAWTGLGGAIVANGGLVRGSRHVAGEIGMTTIDWRGRHTRLENQGALEEYLGSAEIAADARVAYAEAGIEKPLQECSVNALVNASHQGDPVALAQWDRIGRMFAAAAANACWLLNPEAVIVSGNLSRAGELFFKPFREELFERLSQPFKDHLMVLPGSFGADATMIGAAALAHEVAHIGV